MTFKLEFHDGRATAAPVDAATLIVVRDAGGALEVFCVERNRRSSFVGGALVFPGGKVDPSDADPRWIARSTPAAHGGDGRDGRAPLALDEAARRALAIAACREALEEAAILPVAGGALSHDELVELRRALTAGGTVLLDVLEQRGLLVDVGALHPFARWVTPALEVRRFDARFYLVAAPPGQDGAHDEHETTASFWATPRSVLERFVAGSVQLAPPTHRTLELLASCDDVARAVALARSSRLDVVCPVLVRQVEPGGETLALTLPGDPEHPVADALVPGRSRYVLRDGKWTPEDAPHLPSR